MHLDLDDSISATRFTASALDVKAEAPWLVAAHLRFLGLAKVKDFQHTDKLDCAEFVQGASGWLQKVDHISPSYLASISEKKPLAN